MGTLSPIHWIIAIALAAALGAFLYLIGSLLWAGTKEKGKGKLLVAVVLLPLAVLALVGIFGSTKEKGPEQGPWLEYQKKP